MDLGTATLRKSGINILTNALHPVHGLVWSDGSVLYLINHNEESMQLGQFDVVESVHWSCELEQSSSIFDSSKTYPYSLLCLNHSTFLSIWKVTEELQLKQVRRVHATPITQGCLWNPVNDILCVLNKDQCSFYFRHSQNKGNFSLPPIESGKIRCGCWLPNGKSLVIGIGSIVLIYRWDDITKSINNFTITAWKIPRVDGEISCMVPVSKDQIICASEVPLADLCINQEKDLFESQDLTKHKDESQINIDNQNHDGRMIQPTHISTIGHTDSLMNLKTNKFNFRDKYSELVLCDLSCEEKPKKISTVTIPGIVAPSLLIHDVDKNILVVGSNSQSSLHLYQLYNDHITRFHEIKLCNGHYPVGLSESLYDFLSPRTHDGGMLVMIGATSRDALFPSKCLHLDYVLQLQYINYTDGLLSDVHSESGNNKTGTQSDASVAMCDRDVHVLRVNPMQEKRIKFSPTDYHYNSKSDTRLQNDLNNSTLNVDLLLPNALNTGQTGKQISFIGEDYTPEKELETYQTSFEDTPISFKNRYSTEAEKEVTCTNPSSKQLTTSSNNCSSTNSTGGTLRKMGLKSLLINRSKSQTNQVHAEKEVTFRLDQNDERKMKSTEEESFDIHTDIIKKLERQTMLQSQQIEELQNKVEELTNKLEIDYYYDGHHYHSSSTPQTLIISCESESGAIQTKTFILDAGRLQLQPIKHAFNLITVELMLDGIPCVLSNNADGYIPIRFDPDITLHIRGRRAIPEKPRMTKRINSMVVPPTTKTQNHPPTTVTNQVKPISIHELVGPNATQNAFPPDNFM